MIPRVCVRLRSSDTHVHTSSFIFPLCCSVLSLSVKLALAIICRHVVGLELMNNDAGASRRGIKVGAAGAAAKSERII